MTRRVSALKGSSTKTISQFRTGILLTFVILCINLAGCASPTVDTSITEGAITPPADFALELTVQGQPGVRDIMQRSSQYVVEPDRALRVAVGPGATEDYLPDRSRWISSRDHAALYEQIARGKLMIEPTSPGADAGVDPRTGRVPTAIYRVLIQAQGKQHVYRTTADESPYTRRLHEMLVMLAQGKRAMDDPSALRRGEPTPNDPDVIPVPVP